MRNVNDTWVRMWRRMTEPSAAIQTEERRGQAYLLAAILVTLVPVGVVITVSRLLLDPHFFHTTLAAPAVALVVLLVAYSLSRSRHALAGSALAVIAFLGAVVWAIFLDPRPESVRIVLSFMAMVVLLGSLLFRVHGTVILAVGVFLFVALLPIFAPFVSWPTALTSASFLSLICSLIVVAAILRHQAQHRLERQAQELSIVHRVSTAAAVSLEPHRVLELTCQELALAFDVPQVDALILTDDGSAATVVAHFGQDGDISGVGQNLLVEANPVIRYVLAHREPLAVSELQNDPRTARVHELARRRGVASVLALPLMAGDQVVGALSLESYQRRVFKEEEVALAARATRAAANALGHARLFAAEQEARRLSDTLSDIARDLNLAPDLASALQLILAQMQQVISLDSGSILLLEGDALRVVAACGFLSPEEVLGRRLALHLALLNREVIESRRPLIVASVAEDDRWLLTVQDAGLVHPLQGIHSWLGVPLIIQDRVIGMLTADKCERGFYRPQDAELALAFAGHAAVAIENARLLDSERQQLQLANTLREIGALHTGRLTLDEVFEQIFDLLAGVVAYDSVSVQLQDKDGNMPLRAGRGFADFAQVLGWQNLLAQKTRHQDWGAERRVVVVPDTGRYPGWEPWPGSEHIRSWVGAALVVRGQVIGVLNVDSAQPHAYVGETGEMVAAFANQAAVAIENARLYDEAQQELAVRKRVEHELQQSLVESERRSSLLQAASQVSASTAMILDPSVLMQQMVDIIKNRFHFYYVGIFMVDEGGGHAWLMAGTGDAGRHMLEQGHRLPVGGESMIGWCIANAQARIALDVGQEAVRFDNPELPDTRSEMALPLLSRGRCIGALTVQSDQPAAFSDEDIAMLQTMADHLATAMENARLFQAAEEEIERRAQAELAIKQLNESLEQRVAERTADLAAVNRELEAFAYSVSHDLRAPIRRIHSFTHALQEDFADQLSGEPLDYLGRIDHASHQMLQLIDDLLNLSRLTQRDLQRQTVDLSALAREVAAGLRQSQPGREGEVTVEVAAGLMVNGDARLLRIVLENLLGNAWKFTTACLSARVEVGQLWQKENEQAFFVRDNGVGFDMAYADRLFAPFQRIHSTDEFEGTGIGLATVQRIVHRHGGRVWAESARRHGATFFFTLAQPQSVL